jgi:TRAP-type C4-dicarboxylate transport system permease small subunit
MRRVLELAVLGFAACGAAWMAWRLAAMTLDSWRFNEISVGMLPIPLAIPQAVLALGGLVLALALFDELVLVLRDGRPSFRAGEDALTLGKEG